jgi:tetratricopeptide (TPR) repeat protein
MSMQNLARVYRNQGQYDKALSLYITCLEKYKSTLGENHPQTLTMIKNLEIFCEGEKYENARSLRAEFK